MKKNSQIENERVIDVICLAIKELKKDRLDIKELETIFSGFSQIEISMAFSWLLEKFNVSEPSILAMLQAFPDRAFRVFTASERELFTDEAYKLMLKYLALGLMSSRHIDLVLDTVERYGIGSIDKHLINSFIASYMFDAPVSEQTTIGNKWTLTGPVSIN